MRTMKQLMAKKIDSLKEMAAKLEKEIDADMDQAILNGFDFTAQTYSYVAGYPKPVCELVASRYKDFSYLVQVERNPEFRDSRYVIQLCHKKTLREVLNEIGIDP